MQLERISNNLRVPVSHHPGLLLELLNLTVLCWALSLLQLCDGDLPGVYPTEWGQGWGEIQLEPLAVQQAGSHQASGPSVLPLHTAQGEAWPATGSVRASSMQPGQLQSSAQPTMVSNTKKQMFKTRCFCLLQSIRKNILLQWVFRLNLVFWSNWTFF